MARQTQAFGRCFVKNEPSEPVTSWKTAGSLLPVVKLDFSNADWNLEKLVFAILT